MIVLKLIQSAVAASLCALQNKKAKIESDAEGANSSLPSNFLRVCAKRVANRRLARLPPWFAIVAAGPPVAILVTPSSTAAAVATTAAAVTAAAGAIAAVAAARCAVGAWSSFIDSQIAAGELLAVKLFDRRCGLFGSRHLDKAEAPRAASHPIFND
jgi:hypothetical protein